MFTRYESFVDNETTKMYSQIASLHASLLKASNNFNAINSEVKISDEDTSPIALPKETKESETFLK